MINLGQFFMESITEQLEGRKFTMEACEYHKVWRDNDESLTRDFSVSFRFVRGYDDEYLGDFDILIETINNSQFILGDALTTRILKLIKANQLDDALILLDSFGTEFLAFEKEVNS